MARARVLVVGTAESFQARRAVQLARAANPGLAIFARTHSHGEQEALRALGANDAVMGEHELALQLTRLTLASLGLKA